MYSHDSFLNPAASTVSKSLSTVRQKNQFWCFEWYYSYAVIKTYQQQQTLLYHLAFPVPYPFLLFSSPFLCLPSALFFPFTYSTSCWPWSVYQHSFLYFSSLSLHTAGCIEQQPLPPVSSNHHGHQESESPEQRHNDSMIRYFNIWERLR